MRTVVRFGILAQEKVLDAEDSRDRFLRPTLG